MLIDQFLDEASFSETHRIQIAASSESVYRALRELTAAELPLTRFLFALRRVPALLSGAPGLTVASARPLLETMRNQGFFLLAEDPPRELVLGIVGKLWRPSSGVHRIASADEFVAFAMPGFAKAVTNFCVSTERGMTTLTTHTRIRGVDAAARNRFAVYWALIRPGSGLIRRDALRAIKRLAETRARAS
jgi:hypothetical protein